MLEQWTQYLTKNDRKNFGCKSHNRKLLSRVKHTVVVLCAARSTNRQWSEICHYNFFYRVLVKYFGKHIKLLLDMWVKWIYFNENQLEKNYMGLFWDAIRSLNIYLLQLACQKVVKTSFDYDTMRYTISFITSYWNPMSKERWASCSSQTLYATKGTCANFE